MLLGKLLKADPIAQFLQSEVTIYPTVNLTTFYIYEARALLFALEYLV